MNRWTFAISELTVRHAQALLHRHLRPASLPRALHQSLPAEGRADIRHAAVNAWGIAKILHTFTGNLTSDPHNRRDWILTAVWAYSMDFVAAGLIFMVLSSIYLWLKQPRKLLPGAVCLVLGSLLCGLFCFGLRWWM